MTRQQANREILEHLILMVERYPDLRFGQILQMLRVVKPERPANPNLGIPLQNEFYMESEELLNRVNEQVKDI